MRILLVKLSSLGDVVHTLPAVQDILATLPDAQIDWVVEKAFCATAQSSQRFAAHHSVRVASLAQIAVGGANAA